MHVRPFRAEDAPALAALFHDSVRQIGLRDYSPEQVRAWSPGIPDAAAYVARDDGRIYLIAENDAGEPVGYIDIESNGHIDHLYCRPDAVGTGTGRALYLAAECAAIERGIAALFVEASEAARRLFARHGFVVEARRDFERNGVAIHNYRMTKKLDSAAA